MRMAGHYGALLCLLALLGGAHGRASYMTMNSHYCSQKSLTWGSSIMSRQVQWDNVATLSVTVKATGAAASGYAYGTEYAVTLGGAGSLGDYVLEVAQGGVFTDSGNACGGKRIANANGATVTATAGGADLVLRAGRAGGYGAVLITPSVTLQMQATPAPTPAPTPVPTPAHTPAPTPHATISFGEDGPPLGKLRRMR